MIAPSSSSFNSDQKKGLKHYLFFSIFSVFLRQGFQGRCEVFLCFSVSQENAFNLVIFLARKKFLYIFQHRIQQGI